MPLTFNVKEGNVKISFIFSHNAPLIRLELADHQ